jgi:hypothetical protein
VIGVVEILCGEHMRMVCRKAQQIEKKELSFAWYFSRSNRGLPVDLMSVFLKGRFVLGESEHAVLTIVVVSRPVRNN